MSDAVLVIGGGIYGCMAALEIAKHAEVELHEAGPKLLWGISSRTQGRLHRGYHYPRCAQTREHARRDADEFVARFGRAVQGDGTRLYAIYPGSRTSPQMFETEMARTGLELTPTIDVSGLVTTAVDATYHVRETCVDMEMLRILLAAQLRDARVTVHLNSALPAVPRDRIVVDATAGSFWAPEPDWQWEVCEVALIQLPPRWDDASVVVMDGPHGVSVDPVPGTSLHALYHPSLSVRYRSVGRRSDVPERLRQLIGVRETRSSYPCSIAKEMIDISAQYVNLHGARYATSWWSLRPVPPDLEGTDSRPWCLARQFDGALRIMPGKLAGSLPAARRIAEVARQLAGVGV